MAYFLSQAAFILSSSLFSLFFKRNVNTFVCHSQRTQDSQIQMKSESKVNSHSLVSYLSHYFIGNLQHCWSLCLQYSAISLMRSLTLNADIFLGFVLQLSCIGIEVFILPSKKHTDIIFSLVLLWIICILVFIIIPSHPHPHHHPDCLSTSRQSLLDTKALPLAVSLVSPGRRVSR